MVRLGMWVLSRRCGLGVGIEDEGVGQLGGRFVGLLLRDLYMSEIGYSLKKEVRTIAGVSSCWWRPSTSCLLHPVYPVHRGYPSSGEG